MYVLLLVSTLTLGLESIISSSVKVHVYSSLQKGRPIGPKNSIQALIKFTTPNRNKKIVCLYYEFSSPGKIHINFFVEDNNCPILSEFEISKTWKDLRIEIKEKKIIFKGTDHIESLALYNIIHNKFNKKYDTFSKTIYEKGAIRSHLSSHFLFEKKRKDHCINCNDCRGGFTPIISKQFNGVCGIKNCGSKGDFSCLRGQKWSHNNSGKCAFNSEEALCQKDLIPVCNDKKISICL